MPPHVGEGPPKRDGVVPVRRGATRGGGEVSAMVLVNAQTLRSSAERGESRWSAVRGTYAPMVASAARVMSCRCVCAANEEDRGCMRAFQQEARVVACCC